MYRPFGGRLVAALILFVVTIAVAVVAYNLGVSAGVAAGTGAATAAPVYVGLGAAGWFPWFLFFPFGFLFFILFFGLILRVVFWGGRGGHGHYAARQWGDGPGSPFDEWHRRAHDQGSADPSRQPGASGGDQNASR